MNQGENKYKKVVRDDEGGDGLVHFTCQICGYKMYMIKISPTENEVWQWMKTKVCPICRKKIIVKRGHYKK